jgi:TonB family protein
VLQIDREIFDSKPAHRVLGASLLLHVLAAGALLSLIVPTAHEHPRRFTAIYLPRIPSPAHRRSAMAPPKPIATPKTSTIPEPVHLTRSGEALPVEAPAAAPPPAPVAAALSPAPELVALPEPPARQRTETITGLFESVATTANRLQPDAKVLTGGFDSPPNVRARSALALASAAGFGDAASVPPAHSAPRTLSPTGFYAVSAAQAARRVGSGKGVSEPIEILAKPKPIYTEEARRLRIEGEVVLEVLFRASAQVCVLRVVKGLGHGLDASAEIAAMGIRFHPAAEAGRAVDSVGTVKIEFQLAD